TLFLFQSLFLAAALGLSVIVLQTPIQVIGFAAIGATEVVTQLGRAYYAVRIWEVPLALMMMAAIGYFRGQGDAMVPMYLTIAINVVNIIGDLLLVPGFWGLPSYGIVGAAWASLLAQGSGSLAALAIAWH